MALICFFLIFFLIFIVKIEKYKHEYYNKHSCEYYNKHSCEYYNKHSCEYYNKHSCEYYNKHSCEYYKKVCKKTHKKMQENKKITIKTDCADKNSSILTDKLHHKFSDKINEVFIIEPNIYCFAGRKLVIIDIATYKITEILDDSIFNSAGNITLSDNKENIFIEKHGAFYRFNIETREITDLFNDLNGDIVDEEGCPVISNNGEVIVYDFSNYSAKGSVIIYCGSIVHKFQRVSEVSCVDDEYNVYYFTYTAVNADSDDYLCLFKYNVISGDITKSDPLSPDVEHYLKNNSEHDNLRINTENRQLYLEWDNYLLTFDMETLALMYKRTDVNSISAKYIVSQHKSNINIYDISDNSLIRTFKLLEKYDHRQDYSICVYDDIILVYGNTTYLYSMKGYQSKVKIPSNPYFTSDEKYVIAKDYTTLYRYNITSLNNIGQKIAFIQGEYDVECAIHGFVNNALFDTNLFGEIFGFLST